MEVRKINLSDDTYEVIIFDFGGVIMDVDIHKTVEAFAKLNINGLTYNDIVAENGSFFRELELGLITPAGFIDRFRTNFPASKNVPEEIGRAHV